jgi:hypothetical protein
VILLQAHMSSLRYHPLLAAFFGINAATISPLAGSELQGVRFTLRASAREREREKEKEKKAHNNAHTASQAMDVLPLGNAGASARCTSLPDVDGGAPAATPYTPRHTLHISKILPNSGGTRYRQTGTATIARTTFYSWALPDLCGCVCTRKRAPETD